ncbi:MAG: hypothetical protein M1617_07715 [Actinobacteria bacterium]|nr:hypothetical protein [Actinomycetota bacterium]MCL5888156.1 hypothetical protein [Actinomycetota bacterium]
MDDALDRSATQPFTAEEIIDALPFFVMVLDSNHQVIQSNTYFVKSTESVQEGCPLHCYRAMHNKDAPHPDCPLVESINTGLPVTRLISEDGKTLRVTVYPLAERTPFGALYLHFAETM